MWALKDLQAQLESKAFQALWDPKEKLQSPLVQQGHEGLKDHQDQWGLQADKALWDLLRLGTM
jgi:hypothetical protein